MHKAGTGKLAWEDWKDSCLFFLMETKDPIKQNFPFVLQCFTQEIKIKQEQSAKLQVLISLFAAIFPD